MAAPSAAACDPWRFIVVRNRDTLSQLTAALPYGQMLGSASALRTRRPGCCAALFASSLSISD